jgi:hypothetical protein
MKRVGTLVSLSLLFAAALLAIARPAGADFRKHQLFVRAWLTGFDETPSLSSPGRGFFRAIVDEDAGTIQYWFTYDGVANITQSHLHLGEHHIMGGISVFLCTNLGNGTPAGVQTCPPSPGQITGTIKAEHVIGPTAQGISPAEFAELVTAIRANSVYVNLHSTAFPAGEIRGQLVH